MENLITKKQALVAMKQGRKVQHMDWLEENEEHQIPYYQIKNSEMLDENDKKVNDWDDMLEGFNYWRVLPILLPMKEGTTEQARTVRLANSRRVTIELNRNWLDEKLIPILENLNAELINTDQDNKWKQFDIHSLTSTLEGWYIEDREESPIPEWVEFVNYCTQEKADYVLLVV